MPSVVPDTKGRTEKILRSIKALMGGMFKRDVLQKEANNITKNPPLNPTTSACAAFEWGALIGFLGIMRTYTLHEPVPNRDFTANVKHYPRWLSNSQ